MKEARHLVGHLWLTAPRRIKHNVTVYQAEFLGVNYWGLQAQGPLLLFVHLFGTQNKFSHWNFRYRRKHSMSKRLLRKINYGKPSSCWHPTRCDCSTGSCIHPSRCSQPLQPRRTDPSHPTRERERGEKSGLPQLKACDSYHRNHSAGLCQLLCQNQR